MYFLSLFRYTCGFTNLTKSFAAFILAVGFIFPAAILIFFIIWNLLPVHCKQPPGNDKTIIYLVSLCSILLIPHIIQINITHFSTISLNTKVIHTGVFDTFSIWFRYEFNLFTPIILLFIVGDVKGLYNNLKDVCSRRVHYVNHSWKRDRKKRAKRSTPILYVTPDGLMLFANGINWDADPPQLTGLFEQSSSSKVESSTSTTATDSSRTSKEKRNAANKKIVRFAHSVKEISWKDPDKWESSKESSRDRF